MSVLTKEQSNGILTLTLNRPERHNSLNSQIMQELISALQEAKVDRQTNVIVIRGAGDKAFSSGADLGNLDELREYPIDLRTHLSYYGNLLIELINVGKPTIAAVQGYALAGGCGLAVTCDITIASEKGIFGIPEVTRGIWGMMITAPIARIIGEKKSLELMYTGKFISAHEAGKIGLINKVVPSDCLEQEVQELAMSIAEKSPLALSMGREAMYICRDMEFFKAMNYLREMVTLLTASEDAHEGMTAFFEKRRPIWQGK